MKYLEEPAAKQRYYCPGEWGVNGKLTEHQQVRYIVMITHISLMTTLGR